MTVLEGLQMADELKKLPKIYGEIMHSKISEDLRERPVLALYDPRVGVAIVASRQYEQSSGRDEGGSNPALAAYSSRISYLKNSIYFVIMGDSAEFEYPCIRDDQSTTPRVALEELVFHHEMRYRGELPASADIARTLRDGIEQKIDQGITGTFRPRYCEALLVVNAPLKSRSVRDCDKGLRAALYRIAHDRTGDNVVVNEMRPGESGVSYYASQAQLWDDYKAKLATLRRRNQASRRKGSATADARMPRMLENLDVRLQERLVAAVAAITMHEEEEKFNPASIDLVTVPFVLPKGQKARDRYGVEYLVPLYEAAKMLNR
ncbi:hypothetical protein HZB03_00480 [Candidatus Woesearchaeota archaeon]|nr:hypothetical protein [Candidatus Woesearchaeota archaeon]